MTKKRSDQLQELKTYVRLIVEEEGYGSMLDAAAGATPYGMHYASGNQLFNTFVKPFTDVFNTAVGKTKELSVRAQALAKTVVGSTVAGVLPFIHMNYGKIYNREKQSLDRLKSQYKDVYDSSWKALRSGDAAVLGFLCAPEATLTSNMARKAPVVTLGVLNTISGGKFDDIIEKFKSVSDEGGDSISVDKQFSGRIKDYVKSRVAGESTLRGKHVIVEDASSAEGKLVAFITNPKTVSAALNTQKAKKMQADARAVVTKTLRDAVNIVEVVQSAKTLEDVQKATGKKIELPKEYANLSDDEKTALVAETIKILKKSTTEFVIASLKKHVTLVVQQGIPEDSWYVSQYKIAINKLKGA